MILVVAYLAGAILATAIATTLIARDFDDGGDPSAESIVMGAFFGFMWPLMLAFALVTVPAYFLIRAISRRVKTFVDQVVPPQ